MAERIGQSLHRYSGQDSRQLSGYLSVIMKDFRESDRLFYFLEAQSPAANNMISLLVRK